MEAPALMCAAGSHAGNSLSCMQQVQRAKGQLKPSSCSTLGLCMCVLCCKELLYGFPNGFATGSLAVEDKKLIWKLPILAVEFPKATGLHSSSLSQ